VSSTDSVVNDSFSSNGSRMKKRLKLWIAEPARTSTAARRRS
jgi:hypothetical protein